MFKLAPITKLSAHGTHELAVQTYGGGLWHTWFDRDLTLAGKIIVQEESGKLVSMYWNAKQPMLKIPNLAIHLTDRSSKFEPCKEQQTRPVIAMAVIDSLMGESIEPISDDKFRLDDKHMHTLTDRMSKDLGIKREQIIDFEINCVDSQPAGLVGLHSEFISSPRLDNLGSSLVGVDSIIDSHEK